MIDEKTTRLHLPLPNSENFLEDDVVRIREAMVTLDSAATVGPDGIILGAQLPPSLAYLDKDNKIPVANLPSIAISETFVVASIDEMLKLSAQVGDVAALEDNTQSFILAITPPNLRSSWKELTSTQVRTVNGQTGNVVVAAAGENNDITKLKALSGPLRLGGDAAEPYDAVTLKQLQSAAGGAGGASMNGVMNTGIGAVEWFVGSRAKIWAGHITADGQCLSRAANPDLWAAVNSGMLNSVSDAAWLKDPNAGEAIPQIYYNRGKYSTGGAAGTCPDTSIKDAWFRAPDYNGVQPNSLKGLFLRGDGGSDTTFGASSGALRCYAAPNIKGVLEYSNGVGITKLPSDSTGGAIAIKTDATRVSRLAQESGTGYALDFDASRSNGGYGRDDATEIRPNSAKGIWLIRANGSFVSANTNFNVINGDPAKPSNGTVVYGGEVVSSYQVAGLDYLVSKMRTKMTVGGGKGIEFQLIDYSGSTPSTAGFTFDSSGSIGINGGSLRMLDAAGTNQMNIGINAQDPTQAVINRTPNVVALNFNGTQILNADFNYVSSPIVTRLPTDPANPAAGAYLNTPEIRSGFRSRGNYSGVPYAYVSLYSQEHVGDTYSGILQVSGFASNAAFYFLQNGNARAAGSWVNGSDVRHKFKKKLVGDALMSVMAWRGVTYQKLDGDVEVGLIAQDVEKDCPEAVSTSERKFSNGKVIKDFKSLNTSGAAAAFHTEALKGIVDILDSILNDPDTARERVAALRAAMVTTADLESDKAGSIV